MAPTQPGTLTIRGQLIGLFSFDFGYEIDLDRARPLLEGAATQAPERRRAAPSYIGHTTPPLRAPLGTLSVQLGDETVSAHATIVAHEVGAVTIILTMPLECDVTALPPLTSTLTGAGPLEDAARRLADELRPRLAPAVVKPAASDVVEDYYVIQVDRLEPALSAAELLRRARGPLASALRCEAALLSDAEIDDALRTQLSYYPDDLVVTDWNVAIVIDPDYAAAVEVLEYLNVQLLELRYFDALLDRHVVDTYGLATMRARRMPLLNRPVERTLDELAVIRLDVSSMVERLHNAFKLGGDLYLSKLFTRTADRLGLPTWEASVQRKLDLLHERYNVLAGRVSVARSEVLEATIVILIVIELLVLLAGWG
ncbi:MAG: hypothetical protein ACREQL_04190 [Candidatus Binatia bacterium]